MSPLRPLVLVCLASVAVLGCKPADEEEQPPPPIAADDAAESFAREICASVFACECTSAANFESEDQCIAMLGGMFQTSIDTALAAGGTWNEACAGQLVDAWSDWACKPPSAALSTNSFDARLCPIVKGTLGAGADCSRSSLGDNCSEGHYCLSGVCVASVVPVPVGEVCEYDWDELPCATGSYCAYDDVSGSQICKALPKAGDACDPNLDYVCGPGSLDLICDEASSTCVSGPGVGEPCFLGSLCGPGTYCDGGKDFTCQSKFEIGDGCSADAVCPVDASCVSNTCATDPALACNLAYFNF